MEPLIVWTIATLVIQASLKNDNLGRAGVALGIGYGNSLIYGLLHMILTIIFSRDAVLLIAELIVIIFGTCVMPKLLIYYKEHDVDRQVVASDNIKANEETDEENDEE